ncbi:hypothetical protein ACFVVC_01855 [Pseudarthrobacter sp. NPDC058196]|uniref:hypothetical protein n=1 Tax=Pseudarthrobacter sp. NPDC058196 TaxID=3346376 RepID=UPI0036DCD4FE
MRVIRNAKRVSVLGGGVVVVAAGIGLWRAAVLLNGNSHSRAAGLTFVFASAAFIQGCVILLWDRRSTPSALMRPQAADALMAIFPLTVAGAFFLPLPEVRDPASPPFWLLLLALCSMTLSVKPADSAPLSEIPPLHSMNFVDWIRIQNFGARTLVITIWLTVLYLSSSLRVDTWTPLVIAVAIVHAAVSIWRLVEQHQMSKTGLQLSGMQIIWLRAVHVSQGQAAAIKEFRVMYPKIGITQAERVIENLYRTQEVH